jgi:hypothetical protein
MRVEHKEGERGSLKWIQRAVASASPTLEQPILDRTGASRIIWRSPIADDSLAEYRDADFLNRVGLARLAPALSEFWPARGPQWDALALTDKEDVLLVEAKAHVRELCSPGSQATGASRERIAGNLDEIAARLGAHPGRAPWITQFYQLANRLAHLCFLRDNGVKAWLVLVNFIGDGDMEGPARATEWQAAYQVAWHVMGLSPRHPIARFCIEVFPDVADLD